MISDLNRQEEIKRLDQFHVKLSKQIKEIATKKQMKPKQCRYTIYQPKFQEFSTQTIMDKEQIKRILQSREIQVRKSNKNNSKRINELKQIVEETFTSYFRQSRQKQKQLNKLNNELVTKNEQFSKQIQRKDQEMNILRSLIKNPQNVSLQFQKQRQKWQQKSQNYIQQIKKLQLEISQHQTQCQKLSEIVLSQQIQILNKDRRIKQIQTVMQKSQNLLNAINIQETGLSQKMKRLQRQLKVKSSYLAHVQNFNFEIIKEGSDLKRQLEQFRKQARELQQKVESLQEQRQTDVRLLITYEKCIIKLTNNPETRIKRDETSQDEGETSAEGQANDCSNLMQRYETDIEKYLNHFMKEQRNYQQLIQNREKIFEQELALKNNVVEQELQQARKLKFLIQGYLINIGRRDRASRLESEQSSLSSQQQYSPCSLSARKLNLQKNKSLNHNEINNKISKIRDNCKFIDPPPSFGKTKTLNIPSDSNRDNFSQSQTPYFSLKRSNLRFRRQGQKNIDGSQYQIQSLNERLKNRMKFQGQPKQQISSSHLIKLFRSQMTPILQQIEQRKSQYKVGQDSVHQQMKQKVIKQFQSQREIGKKERKPELIQNIKDRESNLKRKHQSTTDYAHNLSPVHNHYRFQSNCLIQTQKHLKPLKTENLCTQNRLLMQRNKSLTTQIQKMTQYIYNIHNLGSMWKRIQKQKPHKFMNCLKLSERLAELIHRHSMHREELGVLFAQSNGITSVTTNQHGRHTNCLTSQTQHNANSNIHKDQRQLMSQMQRIIEQTCDYIKLFQRISRRQFQMHDKLLGRLKLKRTQTGFCGNGRNNIKISEGRFKESNQDCYGTAILFQLQKQKTVYSEGDSPKCSGQVDHFDMSPFDNMQQKEQDFHSIEKLFKQGQQISQIGSVKDSQISHFINSRSQFVKFFDPRNFHKTQHQQQAHLGTASTYRDSAELNSPYGHLHPATIISTNRPTAKGHLPNQKSVKSLRNVCTRQRQKLRLLERKIVDSNLTYKKLIQRLVQENRSKMQKVQQDFKKALDMALKLKTSQPNQGKRSNQPSCLPTKNSPPTYYQQRNRISLSKSCTMKIQQPKSMTQISLMNDRINEKDEIIYEKNQEYQQKIDELNILNQELKYNLSTKIEAVEKLEKRGRLQRDQWNKTDKKNQQLKKQVHKLRTNIKKTKNQFNHFMNRLVTCQKITNNQLLLQKSSYAGSVQFCESIILKKNFSEQFPEESSQQTRLLVISGLDPYLKNLNQKEIVVHQQQDIATQFTGHPGQGFLQKVPVNPSDIVQDTSKPSSNDKKPTQPKLATKTSQNEASNTFQYIINDKKQVTPERQIQQITICNNNERNNSQKYQNECVNNELQRMIKLLRDKDDAILRLNQQMKGSRQFVEQLHIENDILNQQIRLLNGRIILISQQLSSQQMEIMASKNLLSEYEQTKDQLIMQKQQLNLQTKQKLKQYENKIIVLNNQIKQINITKKGQQQDDQKHPNYVQDKMNMPMNARKSKQVYNKQNQKDAERIASRQNNEVRKKSSGSTGGIQQNFFDLQTQTQFNNIQVNQQTRDHKDIRIRSLQEQLSLLRQQNKPLQQTAPQTDQKTSSKKHKQQNKGR